jgi:hypothetical protein
MNLTGLRTSIHIDATDIGTWIRAGQPYDTIRDITVDALAGGDRVSRVDISTDAARQLGAALIRFANETDKRVDEYEATMAEEG